MSATAVRAPERAGEAMDIEVVEVGGGVTMDELRPAQGDPQQPQPLPPRLRRRRQRAPSASDEDDDDDEDGFCSDTTTTTTSSDSEPGSISSPRHLRHRTADLAADNLAADGGDREEEQHRARRRRGQQQQPLANRVPTPQDLAELSYRVYKKSPRRLYAEIDAQGMRVWRDERVEGDVRLVVAVPSWFPKPGAPFDWSRVRGGRVSVVVVIRGTVTDLVGNTRSNLQMLYSRLVDDGGLPDSAHAAASALQRWLLALVEPHPELGGGSRARAEALSAHALDGGAPAPPPPAPSSADPPAVRLALDVTCTGHSLGSFLAEAVTVENDPLAQSRGWTWRSVSFDGPGLPQPYADAALARRGGGSSSRRHWRSAIHRYLAAPNPINMLYPQTSIGSVTHVLAPFELTWSHVARCVVADAARVLGWAVAATVGMDAFGRWRGRRRVAAGQEEEEAEDAEGRAEPAAATDESGAGGNNNNANRSALLQGAAAVAATQLRRAGAGAAIPLLGPLANWALGAAGLAAVPECLAAVLGVEVDELLTQHGLGSMRACFDPDTGELRPECARAMRSWPHLGSRGQVVVLSACRQLAEWTLPSPLCPANVGVVHVSSRTRMVEARCRRLAGYVPLNEGETHAVLDREEEEAEMEAKQAGMAVAMQPLPPPLPPQQQQAAEAMAAAAAHDPDGPLYSAAGEASGGGASLEPLFGALQELHPGPELDRALGVPLATRVSVAAADSLRRGDPSLVFRVPSEAAQAAAAVPGLPARVGQARAIAAAQAVAAQAAARRRQQHQQQQRQARGGGVVGGGGAGGARQGAGTFGPALA
jgi:hypothetical protein